MGEMTKEEIIAALKAANKSAKPSDIAIYADAFIEYHSAQKNIDEHGSIVFHPRTGSPIDNPYAKVRDRASATIRSMKSIKADSLWGGK